MVCHRVHSCPRIRELLNCGQYEVAPIGVLIDFHLSEHLGVFRFPFRRVARWNISRIGFAGHVLHVNITLQERSGKVHGVLSTIDIGSTSQTWCVF